MPPCWLAGTPVCGPCAGEFHVTVRAWSECMQHTHMSGDLCSYPRLSFLLWLFCAWRKAGKATYHGIVRSPGIRFLLHPNTCSGPNLKNRGGAQIDRFDQKGAVSALPPLSQEQTRRQLTASTDIAAGDGGSESHVTAHGTTDLSLPLIAQASSGESRRLIETGRCRSTKGRAGTRRCEPSNKAAMMSSYVHRLSRRTQ